MALVVCTWFWGTKYNTTYVNRLARGLRRHLKQPYRFFVATPWEKDRHLIKIPGCFVRLRMFDPEWQRMNGLNIGDRLVCIDLDTVITGELDGLFDRPETFVILQGANSSNPCPYNGSVMMLKVGCHREVWDEFSLEAVAKVKFFEFPDDQGWLWHMLPCAAGWQCGRSGIYAYRKPGWPTTGDYLPRDARMVVFPGSRDPMQIAGHDWVRKHWV